MLCLYRGIFTVVHTDNIFGSFHNNTIVSASCALPYISPLKYSDFCSLTSKCKERGQTHVLLVYSVSCYQSYRQLENWKHKCEPAGELETYILEDVMFWHSITNRTSHINVFLCTSEIVWWWDVCITGIEKGLSCKIWGNSISSHEWNPIIWKKNLSWVFKWYKSTL